MPYKEIFCHHYDEGCFRVLFNVENFLRTLVRWEIRGRNPTDWKGLILAEVIREAEERQRQEREIGYLDIRKSGLLSYLTLSELKDICLGPLWEPCFRLQWPPHDVVQSEFKKLIAIRNKSAHFRPITVRDLRVAVRFAEDLADWTRNYRHIRQYSSQITTRDENAKNKFEEMNLKDVGSFWQDLHERGIVQRYNLSFCNLGHHVAITANVVGGSVDHIKFLEFIDRTEKEVSFCRIGDLAEIVCCYVPIKLSSKEIIKVFETEISIVSCSRDGMSSEEVRNKLEIPQRENILPWSVELPPDFRG